MKSTIYAIIGVYNREAPGVAVTTRGLPQEGSVPVSSQDTPSKSKQAIRRTLAPARPCGTCGQMFEPAATEVNRGRGRFCSRVCSSRYGHSLYQTRQPIDNNDGTFSIPLTCGKFAIVDAQDVDKVTGRDWTFSHGYARSQSEQMHRVILGLSVDHPEVDHIDLDGLNNRRSNLRLATRAQNGWNRGLNHNSSTKYKGVSFHRASGLYRARITVHGVGKCLGYFAAPEDAARAFDKAALHEYGEFAYLNFPDDREAA